MYRIVVGVDGSAASELALGWAVEVARLRDATVRAVHAWQLIVTGDIYGYGAWDQTALEETARAVLDESVERVDAAGLSTPVERVLLHGPAASTLLDAAGDADLVVVGTRGRGGFAGLLLGSVSHQVVQHAPCPAVVVPSTWERAPQQQIVVGVDGSENARAAMVWALDSARHTGATVEAVFAFDAGLAWIDVGASYQREWVEKASANAEAELAQIVEGVADPAAGLAVRAVAIEGAPARVLLDRAKTADLLVVGSRGRGGFAGLLLGSVSQRCVENARCPVAVVPQRG